MRFGTTDYSVKIHSELAAISFGNRSSAWGEMIKHSSPGKVVVRDAADSSDADIQAQAFQASAKFYFTTNGGLIEPPNTDDYYYKLTARDNGVGIVEVARAQSAADPEFKLGNDGNALVTTYAGYCGFFAATPVGQRLKANYNNWAAFTDVVDALVALGLFDQA